jgi:hypothetical protein
LGQEKGRFKKPETRIGSGEKAIKNQKPELGQEKGRYENQKPELVRRKGDIKIRNQNWSGERAI